MFSFVLCVAKNLFTPVIKDPYLDSAAYRLWGNGVALPCVWFVLAGIVYCDQLDG